MPYAADLAQMLSLVAATPGATRAEIARMSGLARSTVSQRVDALLRAELIHEVGGAPSSGGRPATVLALNRSLGAVLAADLGAAHCRLAVADLNGLIIREQAHEIDIAEGPATVLGLVTTWFNALIEDAGWQPRDVRVVAAGLPGPVEFSTGTVVRPPIMPGWDGYAVPGWFSDHFDAPVLVDTDVNVMALGECWGRELRDEQIVFVKVGTGIGCGIISGGVVHRGADGAAGDIGHIRVAGADDTVCTCGNTGCLESVASGSALARALNREGLDTVTARDVVDAVIAGDPRALRAVRVAGERIGEVLASLVNFYNPSRVVIGGALAELRDDLMAGTRAVVYDRALPLATRHLVIEPSNLGGRAGVLGACVLAVNHALSPSVLERFMSSVPAGSSAAIADGQSG
ncbi:MAG: ROK family transcriptional regulator [Acidimicrobiales bacterium]